MTGKTAFKARAIPKLRLRLPPAVSYYVAVPATAKRRTHVMNGGVDIFEIAAPLRG